MPTQLGGARTLLTSARREQPKHAAKYTVGNSSANEWSARESARPKRAQAASCVIVDNSREAYASAAKHRGTGLADLWACAHDKRPPEFPAGNMLSAMRQTYVPGLATSVCSRSSGGLEHTMVRTYATSHCGWSEADSAKQSQAEQGAERGGARGGARSGARRSKTGQKRPRRHSARRRVQAGSAERKAKTTRLSSPPFAKRPLQTRYV